MPWRAPIHHGSGPSASISQELPRASPSARGYDRKWRRFRQWFLSEHPLCRDCQSRGVITEATEVHHVAKLRSRPDLRLEPSNVMPLCHACHEVRTGRGE